MQGLQKDVHAASQAAHDDARKASGYRARFGRAHLTTWHRPAAASRTADDTRRPKKGAVGLEAQAVEAVVPAELGDAVEIDELCVKKRGKSLWLWIARSRKSGQVLAWQWGRRDAIALARLWHKVPASYKRKLVYTDGYRVYEQFFRAWQHRVTDKTDGRTSRVEALNTLWRARVAGLVRKTCGVCRARQQDIAERFCHVVAWHNLRCLKNLQQRT